jgi:hypothetical protein
MLKSVPGGEAVGRQLDADAQRAGANLVGMAAAGELGKTASFDMAQEHHLGRTVAATVIARIGGAPLAPEHPASRYLREVGTTVAWAAAELRVPEQDRPYPMRGYRFLLVDSPTVNAVGCPGGFVVVTTGLVGQARSEDELAGVLAHEVAHVQRGHTMGPVEAARRQEHLTEGVLRGTSDLAHAFFGKVVTAGADFVLDRGFGKGNELEADGFAARILAAAGYDPAALPAFLSRLGGKSAKGGFFSRHPPARERVEALGGTPAPAPVPPAREARFRRAAAAVAPRAQRPRAAPGSGLRHQGRSPAPPAIPCAAHRRTACAIRSRGSTSTTAPSAMASFGIPKTTQLASSWARVCAPARRISRSPAAPSSPMPVRITPAAFGPAASAADRNSTSTLGRWRETGGASKTSAT